MNKPVACVTGASGGLGQSLLGPLLERYTVRGLFRRRDTVSDQWESRGCRIVLGDLDGNDVLSELVQGADVVFHCAAKIIGFSPREFRQVNVLGTKNLAQAAAAGGCRRFVYVSSIAVYFGAIPGVNGFTEDTPLNETECVDLYGSSKIQAESVVRECFRGSSTEFVIVRPTCVYGPVIRSWTLLPLESIRRGRRLLPGMASGAGRMDAVHASDVVRGLLAAAENPRAAGEVFNLGHESVGFGEFYAYLGRMAGREPRLSAENSLRNLARFARKASRLSIQALASLEAGLRFVLWLSLNKQPFPSGKAGSLLGYSPELSLPVGMLETELALCGRKLLPGDTHRLSNTDRHYVVRPVALAMPATEQDIAGIVRTAAARNLPLRAIGSLHSFVPIPDTSGICISMEQYRRLVGVNGSLVTVQGGMTIESLNETLDRHGLALPIHGSHVAQTVAGAISTGTHGGSSRHGTISDSVEQIRLVRSGGDVIELAKGDTEFGASVVSLGLLGVLSTVTIRCVPKFTLAARPEVCSLNDLLRDWDRVHRENEFVDLVYHPQLGSVELLLINRIPSPLAGDQAPSAMTRHPSRARRRWVSFMFRSLLRLLGCFRGERLHRSVVQGVVGKTYKSREGRSDRVLAFTDLAMGEPFPIDDLEFGVPLDYAVPALTVLSRHFESTRRFPRFFPVHIRCSARGDQWISPNYERDVCWFEFWHHPPNPSLYEDLHGLLAPFDYRPHWAKVKACDSRYLRQCHPKFDDFAKLRRSWDPAGMFLNPLFSELFA